MVSKLGFGQLQNIGQFVWLTGVSAKHASPHIAREFNKRGYPTLHLQRDQYQFVASIPHLEILAIGKQAQKWIQDQMGFRNAFKSAIQNLPPTLTEKPRVHPTRFVKPEEAAGLWDTSILKTIRPQAVEVNLDVIKSH